MNTRIGPSSPSLDSLLAPRSLAVIGASDREGSVGRAVMENLIRGGYRGHLYPVNPRLPTVLGLKAHPSILEIPESVEAAVVAVRASEVDGILGECARKNARAVTVLSAGFKECGEAGRALQGSLERTARELDLVLLGPNCLGLINTDPKVGLNATIANRLPKPGTVSFVSQSGTLGVYALEFAAAHGIGMRMFASIGNKALLHENHLLQAFAADPVTSVILVYLEEFQAPEEFFELAAAVASAPSPKPVVLLKAGTGAQARRAAASHTGALVEKTDFLEDLCSQYGVIRAANLEDLFNHALGLSRQPLPKGPRVAVLTNAGGPGILAVDEAERLGLALPEPSDGLRKTIARIRNSPGDDGNPIDLLRDAGANAYEGALKALLASGEADAVLSVCTPQRMTDMTAVARAIAGRASEARDASIPLLSAMAEFEVPSATGRILDEAGIPDYPFAENAVRTLAAAWRHRAWRDRPRTWPQRIDTHGETARAVIEAAAREGHASLTAWESHAVLQAYGMAVVRGSLATSPRGLRKAAEDLGFPLVAKLESPDILHKVDVGGVITGIGDIHVLERAYATLLARAAEAKPGGALVKGVLVQEMVAGGVEFMMGAQRNPHYGILMAFALGGTLVEAIGDVGFRRAPLTVEDAEGLIRQVRAAAVLEAFRGRPPRDVPALRDFLLRLSWLMEDFPSIMDVDLNPVFSMENGAVIADARIVLGSGDRSGTP